jgi:hypothetical protein
MSTVRNTLNVVRYDWRGFRIGGPEASMRGLWPVLIVALLVVFGCFFAIGRLSTGRGGSSLEESSVAPVAHVAIPSGLQGGSPIAGEIPNSIAAPPQRRAGPARGAETQRATTPSQAFGGATTSTEASSATQPESAPAQAPESSRTSTGTGSSGGKSSAGRASGGAASGSGRSFDSSE